MVKNERLIWASIGWRALGAQLAGRANISEAMNQWQQHGGEFFVKYRTLYSTHPHLLARLDFLNNAAAEFGMR